jgi:hypothetical protein
MHMTLCFNLTRLSYRAADPPKKWQLGHKPGAQSVHDFPRPCLLIEGRYLLLLPRDNYFIQMNALSTKLDLNV